MAQVQGEGEEQSSLRAIVEHPMPERLVVVGDLNGDDDALGVILSANGIIDRDGSWCGEGVHFVQLGDIVNRGSSARAALERLMRLAEEAPARGGRVSVLLGNHEAMVTLGNLAWCSPEEMLDFASPEERVAFEVARSSAIYAMLGRARSNGLTTPIIGALRAWEEQHAPGREAYLRALGPDGEHGRFLRSLPLAIRVGRVLLTHGGLAYRYAEHGLAALHEELLAIWATAPEREDDLPIDSLLLADDGPLWNRRFVLGESQRLEDELYASLRVVGAATMVVGHTRTDQLPGGARGQPALRYGGRLLCADVGIGSSGGAPAALVFEGDDVWVWRPEEPRRRLCKLPPLLDEPRPEERAS